MPDCNEAINFGDNAIFEFLRLASAPCFSHELLQRFLVLQEFQPDHIDNYMFTKDSHGRSAMLELHPYNGKQSFIDNVERIGHDTIIKAGAYIGPYCVIGTKVVIEEGAELGVACNVEHGVTIGPEAIGEDGVTLCTSSTVGNQAILGQLCEIGYGVTLPAHTVVKPGAIATRGYLDKVNFDE